MKLFKTFLLVFVLCASFALPDAQATVTTSLCWEFSEPDIAGFKIHYGLTSGAYTVVLDVGKVQAFPPSGSLNTALTLGSGTTYFFSITSYDSSGHESDYSNEISLKFDMKNSENLRFIFL